MSGEEGMRPELGREMTRRIVDFGTPGTIYIPPGGSYQGTTTSSQIYEEYEHKHDTLLWMGAIPAVILDFFFFCQFLIQYNTRLL